MTEAIQESAFFRVRHTCFIQTVCGLMESGDNIVDRFIELAEEQPEVAKRILLSSVSGLVNLHVVHSLNAKLKRRAEAN
jgi:hypothetical protein